MNKFDLDIPEQASSITIKNHMINDVFEEDMHFFKNLTELNLTDNYKVPMYKLENLPSLAKLNLCMNKLEHLQLVDPKETSKAEMIKN